MLHPDTENHTQSNTSFRSLLAFKPRQLLIARHNPTTTITASASASKDNNSTKIASEMKANLHELILDYLHRNGFTKTLKRFHSEAQIQTNSWKASSLHLEDMFSKQNACDVDSNKNMCKKPGNDEATEEEKVCPTNEETTTKKKKKKVIVDTDDCAIKHKSEVTDKKIKVPSENLGQLSEDIIVDEQETKPKKKKSKHDLVSSTNDATHGLKIDDLTKNIKDKKKKKIEEVKLEPYNTKEKELGTEVAQMEKKKKNKLKTDEKGTIQPDLTKKEKKSSKKRKRESSNENENGSIEMTITEESKHHKTETHKEEKSIKEIINAQETSNKRFDGEKNGKLKIEGVKSKKKHRNVTMEPKTVNAFQRVKIDEVEFAHDKLQDNSYWAKDGAEIGYGAKAQEVLGQVRGRDFRHEKTKKKRGSYRGGLIDQESHSIKFTYSDED